MSFPGGERNFTRVAHVTQRHFAESIDYFPVLFGIGGQEAFGLRLGAKQLRQ